jgi:membrane associated rhomboid family serine protease
MSSIVERQYIFFHTSMGLASFVAGFIAWAFAFTTIAARGGASWWAICAIFFGAFILVLLSFKIDNRFRGPSK